METQELLNKKVGTKETPKLKPAKVKIMGVEIQKTTKDGKTMKSPLANILCKHPDKEELIKMSKIKCLRNDKLEVVSLWVSLDEDGNLLKSSAISELLRFLNVDSLNDLTNKDIECIEQSKEDNYLCLKAY